MTMPRKSNRETAGPSSLTFGRCSSARTLTSKIYLLRIVKCLKGCRDGGAILPLIPHRLSVLAGYRARLHAITYAPSSGRRNVGLRHSPYSRGRNANATHYAFIVPAASSRHPFFI